MNITKGIFKAYDIRGLYPEDLNDDNISQIVAAIYTFYLQELKKETATIVLSRDMRTSSPSLHEKARETLLKLGAHILDIGIASTPTYYFAVINHQADCGIQISASHNPKEYNGLKLVRRDGSKIVKIGKGIGMEQITELAISGKSVPLKDGGKVEDISGEVESEVATAIKSVHAPELQKFKIVADCANAMGAVYLEELFKHIPADVVKMNFELDGTFPVHQADPLQFKLFADLQKKVVEEKADIGIFPDGDGDRVFFVDEKGEIIPATLITSLVVGELLKDHPGERVLVDIRYIRNAGAVIEKLGGTMGVTKVGHAQITEQLNRENAIFAGESSGHFYFRDTGGTESAVRIVLYVLRVMTREKKPISEILEQYHTSIESGETNFELHEGVAAKQVTDKILADYPDGQVSTLDGIAVDFPDWRFSIRSSNTEPLMRLNVEGHEKDVVLTKVKELADKIIAEGAHIKD